MCKYPQLQITIITTSHQYVHFNYVDQIFFLGVCKFFLYKIEAIVSQPLPIIRCIMYLICASNQCQHNP